MNLGLTTSFIIAGILLLSILSMNMSLTQSSTQLTMKQITERRTSTITQIMQKDIPNIGYQQGGTISHPIKDARNDLLKFEGDIDNDGTKDTVTWKYTSSDGLVRIFNSKTTDFNINVTDFEITYLDSDRNKIEVSFISKLLGNDQDKRDQIRHISVELSLQSKEKIGGMGDSDPHYVKSSWEKQFTPINLSL